MKNKITIDKLIAGQSESLPPPDADMMWAEMTAKLDAEAATGGAHPDVEAAAGPGAAAITGVGWMTVAAYLLSGLLGAGALYALATGRWAWSEKEQTETPQAAAPTINAHQELQPPPIAETTAETGAAATRPEAHTHAAAAAARRAALAGGMPVSKGLSAAPGDARRQKANRLNPSGAADGLTPPAQSILVGTQAAGATTSAELPAGVAGGDNTSLLPVAHSGSAAEPIASAPIAWAIAPLPPRSAVAATAAPLAATPTPPNRHQNYQLRGLILYVGSSLEKTPRRYQNFTPKPSYLNVGLAYRLPVAQRWSIQPEFWFMQLETPGLSVATEQRTDLDGLRWLQYDTVSVMRMQGLSLNLTATTELRGGIALLGGVQLGWFPRAMQERASRRKSEVTGYESWGYGYNYNYEPAPYWLAAWQPGLKLGVEKIFWRRAILGINVYQGVSDVTRLPGSSAPANYNRSWLAYLGYRF